MPSVHKMSKLPRPEAEREASPGRVFWITGLSGAGKTTLGRELCSRLRAEGRPVTFLDGDALRSAIAEDLGHSEGDRRRSAMRNARLCRLLAEQGTDVVCATISLFHQVQRWNRENIPCYREIYLRVPVDELRRRDSKGIYAGAQRDVVGIDVPAEAPKAPDLVLDNYGPLDVAAAVDRILAVCAGQDGAGAATVAFKTKAESLEALAPLLRTGRVLPQVRFSVGEWRADAAQVLAAIGAAPLGFRPAVCEKQCTGRGRSDEQLAGREVRLRTRRPRHRRSGTGDRPGDRLVCRRWQYGKRRRPDFRSAHARPSGDGWGGLLAQPERGPVVHHQLRRPIGPDGARDSRRRR